MASVAELTTAKAVAAIEKGEPPDQLEKRGRGISKETQSKDYQEVVVEEALVRNTIVVFEKASDKATIAAVLIKRVLESKPSDDTRCLVIFLAPTGKLVVEHSEVIRSHAGLAVGEYHGCKGMDGRTMECWAREINEYRVMVMTPQIFLDALRSTFVKLSTVFMLIFDECHHCIGKHPYCKIMEEFYYKCESKPKIFGMAASPITKKVKDCEDQLSKLERNLDCKIYELCDRSEPDLIVRVSKQVNVYYDAQTYSHKELRTKFRSIWENFDASMARLQEQSYEKKDIIDIVSSSRKKLSKCYSKVHHCLDTLGLICALEAIEVCKDTNVSSYYDILLNTESGCLEALKLGFISPKLHKLLLVFQSFRISDQPPLIFVERSITAKVINRIMIKCYLLKVNPLLTTDDVTKEELDTTACSLVIRFDLPKTIGSYVRSSEQAQKVNSNFVIMIERGNEIQRDILFDMIRSSTSTKSSALNREEPVKVNIVKEGETSVGIGTTKRKELHGTAATRAFSGSWVHKRGDAILQGYKITFSCNMVGKNYRSFVLLLDFVLDKDVAQTEMQLYLLNKVAKAFIRPCGVVQLDTEQVKQAKLFQEFFFNGLFGELLVRSKESGVPRSFLLQKDDESLWSCSNMYMLLPLQHSCTEEVNIYWEGIIATSAAVERLRNSYIPKAGCSCPQSQLCKTENCESDMIYLANESVQPESIKNMVVVAIHTGRIYLVLEVVKELSANDPFNGKSDESSYRLPSFSEYFHKKYKINLQYPQQPMLLLKNSHNAHNLLSSKSEGEGDARPRKPQYRVHMPPELLIRINVPSDVLRSFYLLPSFMYRLESLMLASQLRSEVFSMSTDSTISSSLILEALTTMRCCEVFSMERLELLGDSVLKYAISSYLYLKFPEENEAELTTRRMSIICNAALHEAGIKHNIQHYIRDAPFDLRRWVAPGQLSLWPSPCECGDMFEISGKATYDEEDKTIVIGKACDLGHRWICSKTISDCVEALLGAYFVGGGLSAACSFLKWLGIGEDLDPVAIEDAFRAASVSNQPKFDDMEFLESKLGYSFTCKDLIVEAVTHASRHQAGIMCNYERLEFLGDSVLDVLITWHLFTNYTEMDPGDLTDLRSATVSNENFAQVAVRHHLHDHLQHCSVSFSEEIKALVLSMKEAGENKGLRFRTPKVLGDLFESIAGAILVDSKFDIFEVWKIFEPLLSPIVTPDNLELPPLRELKELCCNLGYNVNTRCCIKGLNILAELEIQLEDVRLSRQGCGKSKKAAKAQAALLLLKDIEKKVNPDRHSPKRRKVNDEVSDKVEKIDHTSHCFGNMNIPTDTRVEASDPEHKTDSKLEQPVLVAVKMDKGGPRIALYGLCKNLSWPVPKFDSTEVSTSVNGTLGQSGSNRTKAKLPCFVSTASVHVPNQEKIERDGEPRPDKKASHDSAAMSLLYELQKRRWCRVEGK